MTKELITIDGSYGEGGGQILRTALALSAITGKSMRVEKIRAGRKNPGLQAQHLTGVLACVQICDAQLEGAELGSMSLTFEPQSQPRPGEYTWDVREARAGGSAGSVTLVLQTVLWPLALVSNESQLTLHGGTHVPWSPPYHYIQEILAPTVARMGIELELAIERWGWYPQGGGTVQVGIHGGNQLRPIELRERGRLLGLHGLSAVSNLPLSIAERQARRAEEILGKEGFEIEFEIISAAAQSPGTFAFIHAEHENARAGFGALGARGKRAEEVGEGAARDFLRYARSGAAVDMHLADQLILPMALASGPSAFTTCRITRHLLTSVWTLRHFLPARFQIQGQEGEPGRVECFPQN